jgi:hypothetical protein
MPPVEVLSTTRPPEDRYWVVELVKRVSWDAQPAKPASAKANVSRSKVLIGKTPK